MTQQNYCQYVISSLIGMQNGDIHIPNNHKWVCHDYSYLIRYNAHLANNMDGMGIYI